MLTLCRAPAAQPQRPTESAAPDLTLNGRQHAGTLLLYRRGLQGAGVVLQWAHWTRQSIMWCTPWQSGRSASCPCFYRNLGPAKHGLLLHELFEAECEPFWQQGRASFSTRDGQSDVHPMSVGVVGTCNLHACEAGSGISGPQPEPSKLQACSSPEDREAYRVSKCCFPWRLLAQLSASSMRSSTPSGCSSTTPEMLSSPQPSKVRSRSARRPSLYITEAWSDEKCHNISGHTMLARPARLT